MASDAKKIRWMRPSGSVIETNDEPGTVDHCEAQGWKREGDNGGPPRRGRQPKSNTTEASDAK